MTQAQPSSRDLGGVQLFAHMSDDEREVLASRLQVEEFDTGRKLVMQGRPGYSFYVIAHGEVAVQHDGGEVRRLGPGEFVGEIAILGDGRRTATVVAVEPVVTWTLFGTDFRVLQAERPAVAAALEEAMTRRLALDDAGPA